MLEANSGNFWSQVYLRHVQSIEKKTVSMYFKFYFVVSISFKNPVLFTEVICSLIVYTWTLLETFFVDIEICCSVDPWNIGELVPHDRWRFFYSLKQENQSCAPAPKFGHYIKVLNQTMALQPLMSNDSWCK